MQETFLLKVPAVDVEKFFLKIEHEKFQNAIKNQWWVGEGRSVPATSVCWLFCWAKTGQNSEKAKRQAKYVFNQIFEHRFDWLDERLNHELARDIRYGNVQNSERAFWDEIEKYGDS